VHACKIAIWSALPYPIGQKIHTNSRFTNQRFKSIKTFLCKEKKIYIIERLNLFLISTCLYEWHVKTTPTLIFKNNINYII